MEVNYGINRFCFYINRNVLRIDGIYLHDVQPSRIGQDEKENLQS